MANVSAAAPETTREFRVGRVLGQASTVLSRNFLLFFVITTIAGLPRLLWTWNPTATAGFGAAGRLLLGLFLYLVLSMFGQAVVLHGAFQYMRGKPLSIVEALQIALRRLLSIIGIAVCMGIALIAVIALPTALTGSFARVFSTKVLYIGLVIGLGLAAMLMTMWFVAMPSCVVERRRPFSSMGRSIDLTGGHRWKIFGMAMLLFLVAAVIGAIVGVLLGLSGSRLLVALGALAWTGVWGAFHAVLVVVTYHDLRVAKEGVDTDQIASVFD
jgi:hypothetical protein